MSRTAKILIGLGFGDEGKGSLTDYLARADGAHAVIRYNGGSQAAHNVIDSNGRHHTFAQFGSGSFVPGVATYLSRFMLIDPLAFFIEAEHLASLGVTDAIARVTVDPEAMVITPFHAAMNQLREIARGGALHGSCGKGIGETMADSVAHPERMLRAGHLRDRAHTRAKLRYFQAVKRDAAQALRDRLPDSADVRRLLWLMESPEVVDHALDVYETFARCVRIASGLKALLAKRGTVLFEGAQGVLLDEWLGFHPHTTWSTTTGGNAETLLAEGGFDGAVEKTGILRAYGTRHGTGPFPTECDELGRLIPDCHNGRDAWQRDFRVGWFDLVLARYALDATGGVDRLAITCLDRLSQCRSWKIATHYRYAGPPRPDLDCFLDRSAEDQVTGLKADRSRDLDRQETLTQIVNGCRPEYLCVSRAGELPEDIAGQRRQFLALIEHALNVRVRYLSAGPGPDAKSDLERQTILPAVA